MKKKTEYAMVSRENKNRVQEKSLNWKNTDLKEWTNLNT